MNFKNIKANKNLKILKYSILKRDDKGIETGQFQKGASELIKSTIKKFPGSLLTGPSARVVFEYANKNIIQIDGPVEDVLFAAIAKIKEKKNPAKRDQFHQAFMTDWNNTTFSLTTYQKDYLNKKIKESNVSVSGLARDTNQNRQSVYYQLSGERGITIENALKYANKLNVDPADLLLPKQLTSVWGYVNTLQDVVTDENYYPGRVYPSAKKETVVVPRDIYKSNIRAIKIDARGSMYHNQVAFYYKDNQSNLEINNKLCVVGVKVKGFFDEELTHYYFGLYEEYRGKKTLLNPDPYCDESKKIIYQDFDFEFISPVVSLVDPKSIQDATVAGKYMPTEVLMSQQDAERKLADLTVQYEFKMKDLKLKNEKDRLKGAKLLDEYEKAQRQLQEKTEQIKRTLSGEVMKAVKDLYYETKEGEKALEEQIKFYKEKEQKRA